jgi:hypothetical protein
MMNKIDMGNTIILIPFSLPVTLLTVGWWSAVAQRKHQGSVNWRSHCIWLALTFATVATLTAMAFWFSWNASGGSPHGMMPAPGLWVRLRDVWELSVFATVATGVFAKGKGRVLAISAGFSVVCVIFLLSYIEMILE